MQPLLLFSECRKEEPDEQDERGEDLTEIATIGPAETDPATFEIGDL